MKFSVTYYGRAPDKASGAPDEEEAARMSVAVATYHDVEAPNIGLAMQANQVVETGDVFDVTEKHDDQHITVRWLCHKRLSLEPVEAVVG